MPKNNTHHTIITAAAGSVIHHRCSSSQEAVGIAKPVSTIDHGWHHHGLPALYTAWASLASCTTPLSFSFFLLHIATFFRSNAGCASKDDDDSRNGARHDAPRRSMLIPVQLEVKVMISPQKGGRGRAPAFITGAISLSPNLREYIALTSVAIHSCDLVPVPCARTQSHEAALVDLCGTPDAAVGTNVSPFIALGVRGVGAVDLRSAHV